jgi:hypothetical protein
VAPVDRLRLDRRLVRAGATVTAIDRERRKLVGLRDGRVVELEPDGPPAPIVIAASLPASPFSRGRPVALLGLALLSATIVAARSMPAGGTAHVRPSPPAAMAANAPPVVAPPPPRRHHRRHHHRHPRHKVRHRPLTHPPPLHLPAASAEPAL